MSKTAFLSAGHGGYDPGAVAYGMKEKDIVLQMLLSCKSELERHGVNVVASRVYDENDPVEEEVREANASEANIAVSFHVNAGEGDGFEAFYYTSSASGKKLAGLGEKYVKQLGQNSRGLKSGNHLYFVRNTDMPAVLFESFFIDNDADNNIGDTVAKQKAFGVAYAKAILEYLGITYKAPGSESKPSTPTNGELYRVRRSWGDAKSQIGAYKDLENAKRACKDGYFVFNSAGSIVYPGNTVKAYKAKVTADVLNIRKGPGTNYSIVGTISDGGIYTIVEERNGWGKLKSGAGWISLNYVKRV